MELAFVIYSIHLLDQIGFGLVGATVALTIVAAIVCGVTAAEVRAIEDKERWTRRVERAFLSLLITIPLTTTLAWLAPDKETSYTILAAYGVQSTYSAASESEEIQRVAGKSLKMIETYIDRYNLEGKAEKND